jgi:hypothetical protein
MLRLRAVLLAVGISIPTGAAAAPAETTGPRSYGGPIDISTGDPAAPVEAGAVEAAPGDAPVEDAPAATPGDDREPLPPTAQDDPEKAGGNAVEDDVEARVPGAEGTAPVSPSKWMRRHRFIYRNFLAFRANPLGAVDELTLAYRLQLSMRETLLFADTYLLAGAHVFATPAFVRLGPVLEIQPLAALNFSATYDFISTFSTFGQTQSYPSATSSVGPHDIRAKGKRNEQYATIGQMLTLSGVFQFKVKHIAMRNIVKAYYTKMRLRDGDRVFYDPALDIAGPRKGWTLTYDADLIYLFDFGLSLLVRNTLTHAFYQRDDFRPGEPVSQPNGPTLRVGPAAAFTIFDRPGVRFNRPTVFLLTQWWYRHRFRTGEQTSAGIPYIALGFQFDGDLFPSRKDTERGKHKRAAKRRPQ